MRRLLLILPSATYRAADFMAAARSMGVAVTVASERRSTLDAVMGPRALTVDLSDPCRAAQAIVARARHTDFAAIVAVDDQGALTAALAAEELGLAHNPSAAVARTRDKAAMRRALARAGVPQPRFAVLDAGVDGSAAVAETGWPCVIKPLSLSGSRGVIRADDHRQMAASVARVRAISIDAGEAQPASLLIESYLPGVEVAVEGLLRCGDLTVLAVFDKPDPLEGPYFEETLYVTPSRLPADVLDRVHELTALAAEALGLREGPIHAELRVDGRDVGLLELGARSIGGLCGRALRFGLGITLEELILRHALGAGDEELAREATSAGVMMIPIPRPGVLVGVDGLTDARAVAGIDGVHITIPTGRPVVPLPEGDRYLGFLFARDRDGPGAVESALREAHSRLQIRIGSASERGTGDVPAAVG